MKKQLLAFYILLAYTSAIMAQRPIGTWKTFLPYGSATQVCQSSDRIYCATPYALFYQEKSDGSVGTLTKSTGLSDADVRHIAYHQGKNSLIITYASSNIDVIVNETDIYNIPDIKNAIIGSSKNINDVEIIGDYAYLATDLGISVLDLDKYEIKDNYIIGKGGGSVRVNAITSDGTTIYAATAEGLKSASLSSVNLQDYTVWTVYDTAFHLPPGEASLVGQLNGRVYTVIKDSLFSASSTGMIFTKLRYDTTYTYQNFSNTGTNLYASLWGNNTGKVLQINPDGTIAPLNPANVARPSQVANDGANLWVADEWGGLLKYDQSFNFIDRIIPNGPPDNGVFSMGVANHTLYLAAGGTGGDPNYKSYSFNFDGPILFDQKDWTNYSINSYSQIAGCYDLVDVAVDKAHNKVYYASLQDGVIEMNMTTHDMVKYDTSNSSLQQLPNQNRLIVKVSALCLDQSGNLWMSNTGAPQALVVKTADGHWASFSVPASIQTVRRMTVDQNGYIWMGGDGGGMVIYDPGQDPLSSSDDQAKTITATVGNGNLPNVNVWSIVSDNEGNIWVGTDIGIATFYCTGSIFSTNGGCDATWIKVNQGGFIGYLFSTEIVQAMAVDGADRKWIGTTNGVWLISADGTQQLLQFNTDNSPIPNNNINYISLDQQSGEVFIGTQDGLVSYQGDAVLGNTTKGTALVYPNPVKHDYQGTIAIKGLVENAYVKITDIAGTLVYQGHANGGQMVWDGKGYSGNKVATGIYMVYADADDGSQHNVAKIIFLN